MCQTSCFTLLLFTSYMGNLSHDKKRQKNISLLKWQRLLRDLNENLNFSTTNYIHYFSWHDQLFELASPLVLVADVNLHYLTFTQTWCFCVMGFFSNI